MCNFKNVTFSTKISEGWKFLRYSNFHKDNISITKKLGVAASAGKILARVVCNWTFYLRFDKVLFKKIQKVSKKRSTAQTFGFPKSIFCKKKQVVAAKVEKIPGLLDWTLNLRIGTVVFKKFTKNGQSFKTLSLKKILNIFLKKIGSSQL